MAISTATPRILIIGSTGQLGRELQRSFAGFGQLNIYNRQSLDLTNAEAISAAVSACDPTVIINAAAYTAVDRAESEPELARAINAAAPRVLAEEARKRDAIFIHYSTDYVFDGSKNGAWTEDDATNPLNAYGASKLQGESAVLASGGKSLIFRTSWVYGPRGSNFLLTMLRLGRERDRLSIVNDQIGAPTTSIALADATRGIVEGIVSGRFGSAQEWAGLYHMTCSGSTSWFGFAQAIFARSAASLDAKTPQLTSIPTESYPTPARRPRNSVLSNEKLAARFGVRMPSWELALDAVFDQLVKEAEERAAASTPR
jgi:dTDP-4-dehydrorhamnose reductase